MAAASASYTTCPSASTSTRLPFVADAWPSCAPTWKICLSSWESSADANDRSRPRSPPVSATTMARTSASACLLRRAGHLTRSRPKSKNRIGPTAGKKSRVRIHAIVLEGSFRRMMTSGIKARATAAKKAPNQPKSCGPRPLQNFIYYWTLLKVKR
jgi:hypothetical protein